MKHWPVALAHKVWRGAVLKPYPKALGFVLHTPRRALHALLLGFKGTEFGVQVLEFRLQGLGFVIPDSAGFRVQGLGFRVYRVHGSGFRVQGSGLWVVGETHGLSLLLLLLPSSAAAVVTAGRGPRRCHAAPLRSCPTWRTVLVAIGICPASIIKCATYSVDWIWKMWGRRRESGRARG